MIQKTGSSRMPDLVDISRGETIQREDLVAVAHPARLTLRQRTKIKERLFVAPHAPSQNGLQSNRSPHAQSPQPDQTIRCQSASKIPSSLEMVTAMKSTKQNAQGKFQVRLPKIPNSADLTKNRPALVVRTAAQQTMEDILSRADSMVRPRHSTISLRMLTSTVADTKLWKINGLAVFDVESVLR